MKVKCDIYKCKLCGEIFLVKHKEHSPEHCWCKQTMIDWSDYYIRASGQPILLRTIIVDTNKRK